MNSATRRWFAGTVGASVLINRLRDAFQRDAAATAQAVTTTID
jgi:hypothetical protein